MSFFNKLMYSMVKFDKYPDMVKQGIGKAFLYLFLFTLLFGTLNSIIIGYQINRDIGKFVTEVSGNIPEFTFSGGLLDVKEPMPIVYDNIDGSTLIIDTDGQTTPGVLDQYESATLILEDRVITKENGFSSEEYSFSDFTGITFDQDDVINKLPLLKWFSAIAAFFVWIGFFIGKLFSALLLSLLGLIIAAIRKTKLSFGRLYSLSIYALTIPILLDILLQIFQTDLHNLIYYAIALVYMWIAMGHFKEPAIESMELDNY
ncbi:DUF1189 domain-containing protein [Cytobacillus sp. S13-E01]|uniref:DUF1189 domain-containing protein n=1 Tax=Cytobacillus sp. S13-E01 TaxID=3031326 RepID=UPI0023D7BD0C|nr:DUF1189 domain-containing protein [Cytobacillus sp. S13-E01]MDF0728226.1 DUF1189 domain-containing protein [Cytobacillus sp. S13-E01]